MGYCLNVMRGCLASMAEIDTHWREFVHSLEGLSARMHGPQDLEQVLLGVHTLLHDAVRHAQKNGPRLSAQVRSSLKRNVIELFRITDKSRKRIKLFWRKFYFEKGCYSSYFLCAR